MKLEVKEPLAHVMSVRMESDDMRKLEQLAMAHGVGITTMARILLRKALTEGAAHNQCTSNSRDMYTIENEPK